MKKETLFYLKDLFSFLAEEKQHGRLRTKDDTQRGLVNIPIISNERAPFAIPVRFHDCPQSAGKLNKSVLRALGGEENIETYREIPGSRRIRVTLLHPERFNEQWMKAAQVRFYMRIGKRILHIFP